MSDAKAIEKINQKVYDNGAVDRSHLLEFLETIPSNDARQLMRAVRSWLENLHNDSKYSHVNFPEGDIEQILGDLDSYGRVKPETILEFRQNNPRTVNK